MIILLQNALKWVNVSLWFCKLFFILVLLFCGFCISIFEWVYQSMTSNTFNSNFISFSFLVQLVNYLVGYFTVLGIESRSLLVLGKPFTTWVCPQYFCICFLFYFWDTVSLSFCPGWPWAHSAPVSTPWVDVISGVCHQWLDHSLILCGDFLPSNC